jgi:hypothetical protein
LTDTYYHEARHGYQFSLMSATNDEDHDRLVNNIPIAPNDIFKDTVAPRAVCDEFGTVWPDKVRPLKFNGPGNPDPYGYTQNKDGSYTTVPGVWFAIEMDAWTFASQQPQH